jgi:glycosyltransferase involved in cell wall biosynthesis
MRAGVQLQVLALLFEVTLVILASEDRELELLPPDLRTACSSVLRIWRPTLYSRLSRRLRSKQMRVFLDMLWPLPWPMSTTTAALSAVAATIASRQFDIIHCFQMHTARLIGYLGDTRGARLVLDLDDLESPARFRPVPNLTAQIGRQFTILRWLDGVKYAIAERLSIPRFHDGYVCSELGRKVVMARYRRVKWSVVPNVVPAVPPCEQDRKDSVFTYLFVGTLIYAPNKDGILFFCREVLPLLRKGTRDPFRVVIVGRDPDPQVLDLARIESVEVVPNAPTVVPYYRVADACIVPLRMGAGTRIKILEALSYGIPVVSTTIGAEGLDLVPGLHAEIADSAADFAEACRRLMTDERRRLRLADAGHQFCRGRYSVDALGMLLAELYRPLLDQFSAKQAETVPARQTAQPSLPLGR